MSRRGLLSVFERHRSAALASAPFSTFSTGARDRP